MPASVAAQSTPPSQARQRSATALRDSLRAALSFLASFDHGFDADYAHSDRLMYTAPSYRNLDEAVRRRVEPRHRHRQRAGPLRRRAAVSQEEHASRVLQGSGERRVSSAELERHGLVLAEPQSRHGPRARLRRPAADHGQGVQQRGDLGRLHARRQAAPLPDRRVRRFRRVESEEPIVRAETRSSISARSS